MLGYDLYRHEYCPKTQSKKIILRKIFSSWWIIQFLEKTMENVRKHRNIKLVTTERGSNYLVSEPNYHATKCFTKKLLAI